VVVRAHRQREWQEHIVCAARGGIEAEQRADEVRALGRQRSLGIDDLDLIALEHGDVGELAVRIGTAVLDHEQAGLDDFDDEAERRDHACRAPDREPPPGAVVPHPQVNARPFDRRRELRQRGGVEGQRVFDAEGSAGGWQIGHRNRRRPAFFAPEARPEHGIDDALDRGGVGDIGLDPGGLHFVAKVLGDRMRDGVRGRVVKTVHVYQVTPLETVGTTKREAGQC